MFKGLFAKKDKKAVRALEHPKDLQAGDLLVFDDSFSLPEVIRGQQFQVCQVNSYEFENSQYPEFVLQGVGSERLFLTVQEDDQSYLALTKKLSRSDVESCFNLKQLSDVFAEGNGTELTIDLERATKELGVWLDQGYREETDAAKGYFYSDMDCRHVNLVEHQQKGQVMEYYALENADEDKLIEIEVWSDGDTDIMASLVLPINAIRELWPGEKGE